MIVDCVHPVPVRVILPGMRTERVGFKSFRTPVELRGVPASEFEPVGWGPFRPPLLEGPWPDAGIHDLWERDGRLWHRMIRYRHDSLSTWNAPLRPEEFRGLLQGATLTDGNDFGKHFVGTPVARRIYPSFTWNGSDREFTHRGDTDLPGVGPGHTPLVVTSHEDEARAALQATFADDVAIVGDEVFVRVAGPMLVADRRLSAVADRLTLFPRMVPGLAFASHLDGGARLTGMLRTCGVRISPASDVACERPDKPPSRPAAPDMVAVPRGLIGTSDIDAVTARIPEAIHSAVAGMGRHRGGRAALRHPDLVDLRGRLAAAVPLAQIGVFAQASLADRVESLLADVSLVRGMPGGDVGWMRFASAYLTEVAIPRLQAAPSPEDEEAMGGLAP